MLNKSVQNRQVVVGLGITGLSVMRWLKSQNSEFCVFDTRDARVLNETLLSEFEGVEFYFGERQSEVLQQAKTLYLSPGISLNHPVLHRVDRQKTTISGDLDLFMLNVQAPVVAITGSNAKSTVTTLVARMAEAQGIKVAAGGNLGTPMLELLDGDVELYVLELSSFQLERSGTLNTRVACILNVSADHLDHHGSMIKYLAAKQHIYSGANTVVFNRDDRQTFPLHINAQTKQRSFGASTENGGYCIADQSGMPVLMRNSKTLLSLDQIKLSGRHNLLNIMGALEIGAALQFSEQNMLQVAREFKGLPHRCEFVLQHKGVRYINDSKATNVGAALASLQGVQAGNAGKTILIAGGDAKSADFTEFGHQLASLDCDVVLIGCDAKAIAAALQKNTAFYFAGDMQQAVLQSSKLARAGDTVLLAPACASFDMFENYMQRGEVFKSAVMSLLPDTQRGGES